ncbi:MAG: RAMP superfamily CRISPR-associated protein [Candidatus Helarchaeota archaeon]
MQKLEKRIIFQGRLIPQTPFRIGSSQQETGAYNAVFRVLDIDWKEIFVIPASSIRGILSNEFSRLLLTKNPNTPYCFNSKKEKNNHDVCIFCEIFGSQQRKGKLKVMDCFPITDKVSKNVRPRIAIDRSSRTTPKGHLAFFESITPLQPFYLKLILENFSTDNDEYKLFLFVLYEIMKGYIRIGGLKSVGFGAFTIKDFQVHIYDYKTEGTTLIQPITKEFQTYFQEVIS